MRIEAGGVAVYDIADFGAVNEHLDLLFGSHGGLIAKGSEREPTPVGRRAATRALATVCS